MDDVTSSLDAENESQFLERLEKIQGMKTIILVTNRLQTAKNADLLLVLREGEVKMFGETKQLLQDVKDLSTSFELGHVKNPLWPEPDIINVLTIC